MVAKYQQSIADRDTELSKTQQTLFELEKKFGTAQNNWKTEKDRLNAEIKQQNQRYFSFSQFCTYAKCVKIQLHELNAYI